MKISQKRRFQCQKTIKKLRLLQNSGTSKKVARILDARGTEFFLVKDTLVFVFFRGRIANGLGDTAAAAKEGIIDFKGKLQIGNYTYNLSKSATAGTALDGFNLVDYQS